MRLSSTPLDGCLEVHPTLCPDERGLFVKPYSFGEFTAAGLPTEWREHFYSRSNAGVVRGLHFQRPPSEQDKLVYCVHGTAFDVVVDLRAGSPTYGKFTTFHLDDKSWRAIFIPAGMAHGFLALEPEAVMAYAVTTEHDPALDTGILWNSVGIPWPVSHLPVVSPRDAALPRLDEFVSPFV